MSLSNLYWEKQEEKEFLRNLIKHNQIIDEINSLKGDETLADIEDAFNSRKNLVEEYYNRYLHGQKGLPIVEWIMHSLYDKQSVRLNGFEHKWQALKDPLEVLNYDIWKAKFSQDYAQIPGLMSEHSKIVNELAKSYKESPQALDILCRAIGSQNIKLREPWRKNRYSGIAERMQGVNKMITRSERDESSTEAYQRLQK